LEQVVKINQRQTRLSNAGPVYMYSTGSKQHLYVSQPELLRELGLHTSLDLGRPSYLAEAFQPLLGDGIIRANGNDWAYQRKLIAPEFFLNKVKVITRHNPTSKKISAVCELIYSLSFWIFYINEIVEILLAEYVGCYGAIYHSNDEDMGESYNRE
jgi:hypothetical protein